MESGVFCLYVIVILVDDLDLDVYTTCCNLLIISWRLLFLIYHIGIREIQELIIRLNNISRGSIFKAITTLSIIYNLAVTVVIFDAACVSLVVRVNKTLRISEVAVVRIVIINVPTVRSRYLLQFPSGPIVQN